MEAKRYFQDVRTLSDEELEFLSEEIQELCHADDWGGTWCDDEAEDRYYQFLTEIRRRNPQKEFEGPEGSLTAQRILSSAMEVYASNTCAILTSEPTWNKPLIGDKIKIRFPMRTVGQD